MTDDEFPNPETELAFLDFLATEWTNWRHHVGSDHWHIRRRSFLAGRPAPQALVLERCTDLEVSDEWERRFGIILDPKKCVAATPAVGGEREELADKLDGYATLYASDYGYDIAADLKNAAAALRAQPDSPLRGREALLAAQSALNNPLNMDLRDRAFHAINLALSASPPEQPAALPLAVRLRDEACPPLPQMVAQRRAQLSQEQRAQPQYLSGCLHPGTEPNSCQYEGQCLSASCNHNGKTTYRPRMTLEAQVDGILYPKETGNG